MATCTAHFCTLSDRIGCGCSAGRALAPTEFQRPSARRSRHCSNCGQKAADLQPLYKLADGSERLLPTLMFKKTLKLDLGKIQKLRAAEGAEGEGAEWEVKLKDGEEQTLTLLRTLPMDGKPATLEGFVGRVPAGYKLFPVHTVAEIQFDDAKEEAKP